MPFLPPNQQRQSTEGTAVKAQMWGKVNVVVIIRACPLPMQCVPAAVT